MDQQRMAKEHGRHLGRADFLRLCLGSFCGVAFGGTGRATSLPTSKGAPTLRIVPVELHLRHAWTLSRNTSTSKNNFLVELSYKGISGLGEAAPNVRFGETPASAAADLKRAAQVVSEVPPWERGELARRLKEHLPLAHSVRAAVDIACWDWHAKSLKVPLYQLLGLSLSRLPRTSFSLSIAAKDELARKIKEASEFPLLKVKLGAKKERDGTTDEEMLATLLEHAADKQIRVDPNEGWAAAEAVTKLRWLASLKRSGGGPFVELCEQPLPAKDRESLRGLHTNKDRPKTVPILLDESVLSAAEIPSLQGMGDGIVVKLQKAGGITPALEQITVARAIGLSVMLGCMIESSVGITAAAHLGPLCDYLDLDGHLLIDNDPVKGVVVKGGNLHLPDGPGLGVRR